MNKVKTNRKTTKGRLISYQDIYQTFPILDNQEIPLKLNWIMKFLIWLHLAKVSDFQKHKLITVGFDTKRIKTIKHRQRSGHQIKIDNLMEERAKRPVKKMEIEEDEDSGRKQERKDRKLNEKFASRGMLVYDSASKPPLTGSILMKAMKSS